MSLSKCMRVVERLSDQDQTALLARAEQLQAEGMSPNRAALQASTDLMADLQKQAASSVRRSAAREYPLAAPGERYSETSHPITMMTPDEFLGRVRPLDIDEASRDNIDDLKSHIMAGRKLDPLRIHKDGKEDGRHRAVAARELGIGLVPVVDEQVRRSAHRDQTETPEFKAWFGGSKVVDDAGKPLVLYHGTRADFDTFGNIGSRFKDISKGFYFTTSTNRASVYADSLANAAVNWRPESPFAKDVEQGANVMPVYLRISNPLLVTDRDGFNSPEDAFDAKGGALIDAAKQLGHDGIIFRRRKGDGYDEVAAVAFKPGQAKSAIGNNGQFDAGTDNIMRSAERSDVFDDPPEAEQRVVQDGIEGGSLPEAVKFVLEHAPSRAHRVVADTVLRRLGELQREGVRLELNVAHAGDAAPRALRNSRGLTQWKGGVATSVWLNGMDMAGRSGMSFETVLHEAVHAATMASVQIGSMPTAAGTDLARDVDDLYEVSNTIVNHLNRRFIDAAAGQTKLTDFEQGIFDGATNALRDPHEVISWALTNADAQAYLEGIQYRGPRSLWDAFVGAVRVALGIRARNDTALSEVLRVSGRIMSSPVSGLADAGDMAGIALQRDVQRSAERQTDTAAFKRWFGDSKVVDAEGKPLVVYHGTSKAFNRFKASRQGTFGPGMYFANTQESAEAYLHGNDGERVVDAFLSLQNPWTPRAEFGSEGAYAEDVDSPIIEAVLALPKGRQIIDAAKRSGTLTEYAHFGPGLQRHLKELGYDGIIADYGDGSMEIVAFRPEQIKSATGNSGAFDPADPDITRSVARPVFYGQLQRAIAGAPARMDGVAAPQWKQWLEANAGKLGVKKDEVEWSGITDYLAMRGKEKVGREDLVAYLADNGVQVTETVLGDPGFAAPKEAIAYLMKRYDRSEDEIREDYGYSDERDYVTLANQVRGDGQDTSKYGRYTVPGGENYREVLIALPDGRTPPPNEPPRPRVVDRGHDDRGRAQFDAVLGDKVLDTFSNWADAADFAAKHQEDAAIRQNLEWQRQQPKTFKSSHWDQPNILAHLRVDDRTDADGKRVLFINEIQSDWGQDGKKKGFAGDGELTQADYSKAMATLRSIVVENDHLGFDSAGQAIGALTSHADWKDRWDVGGPENEAAITEALRVREQLGRQKSGALVPRAPFVGDTKAWAGLALKRAIMMAVDGGYDRVALISGAQAADLYDLRKQIDRIDYNKNGDGTFSLSAIKGGSEVFSREAVPAEGLEEIVGKDVAKKIVGGAGDPAGAADRWEAEDAELIEMKSLTGLNLASGGEGMLAFYDEIIPQVARDVLKKVGGGGLTRVEFADERKAAEARNLTMQRSYLSKESAKYAELTAKISELQTSKSDQLGFGITDAMREKLAGGAPLFSRARDIGDLKLAGGYVLADLMKSAKKVNWWDKTVGSQYHLAEKHPAFKRVYDSIQGFLGDVSKYAVRAADMAPTVLPKLETLGDLARRPLSVEDTQALSDPVFQGTLMWRRDDEGNPVRTDDVGAAGVVWRDAELREMFNLNEAQIALYRETRKAINKSLTDLGITDMLRYAGKDVDAVREAALGASNAKHAGQIIVQQLDALAEESPARAETLANTARVIKEKADMVHGLIARGYAPLSRFGDYTVYVTKDNGKEQVFFGMYETEREANRAKRAWENVEPDAKVTTGTMSKEGYKLFKGVTPETLSLFGESLGLEESASDRESLVFQEYLKAAKTNRSAMKRMIERKGVAGYSEDVGRVLAGFVYSNARQASTNLNAGAISKAASEVPDGDLKDHAIRLVEYTQTPADEANAIRGLLFANFIGGSVASAMVNLTQSFTMTLPVLTQHFGLASASKALTGSLKVVRGGAGVDDDLRRAMKRAQEDGVTAPQETHHLQAQAAGRSALSAGDGTTMGNLVAKTGNFKNKFMLGWGSAFGWAEQMNRKIAFAAAYNLARERGASDPYTFAKKIVDETQFVLNKGNNPVWARGAVGATLFTFKKFGFAYLESLARMWGAGPEGKKAFALSLGVLFLLAGTGGFPFADDLDDLIDGFAQRVLNKSFSSKAAKKEFFANLFGEDLAQFIESGLSGLPGAPIDVSGRLGMGNVVPGTGVLPKKQNYSRDVAEVGGAAASFLQNLLGGAASLAQGDVRNAAMTAAPLALGNVSKGWQMMDMGYYTDSKGRKVIDTTTSEAIMKMIGFQPASVKNVQEATITQQGLIALNKIRETEIADLWSRGRIERKPELVERAKEQLREWNRENPTSPISIDPGQINRRVKQAMMDKAQRISATAPKEIRSEVKRVLEEQSGR